MTTYAIYFDVAGHPSDQPVLCAGGFLSSEESWRAFAPAWNAALQRNCLPDVFHMTDFESKYKNHKRHYEILKGLIDVAADHLLASFSNTIDMKGYRQINNRYPLEEMFGKPYGISARSAARLAYHWQNRTGRTGLTRTFVERGTLHEGDMVECFRRDGLDDPLPVPKELPAVQAADLFAWERAYFNRTSIVRPSHSHLKKRMPDNTRGNDGKWDRPALLKALDNLAIPPRSELPENVRFSFNSSPKKFRKRTIK